MFFLVLLLNCSNIDVQVQVTDYVMHASAAPMFFDLHHGMNLHSGYNTGL